MDGKPQNVAEQVAAVAAGFSFGGAGIFYPEEWLDGTKRREPADVIWANQDCAILFYHKSLMPNENVERWVRRTGEAVESNYKQAAGALDVWRRSGQPIKGKRDGATCDFPLGNRKIVVVSMCDSPHTRLEFREDWRDKLGVEIAATVPHSFVCSMSDYGLPAIDFCRILASLVVCHESVEATDAASGLHNYTGAIWSKVTGRRGTSAESPHVVDALRQVSFMRRAPHEAERGGQNAAPSMKEALVDMSLEDIYTLVQMLAETREGITETHTESFICMMSGFMMLCIVGHTAKWGADHSARRMIENWGRSGYPEWFPARGMYVWDQSLGLNVCMIPEIEAPTALWSSLEAFHQTGSWPEAAEPSWRSRAPEIVKYLNDHLHKNVLPGKLVPWKEVDPDGARRARVSQRGSVGTEHIVLDE